MVAPGAAVIGAPAAAFDVAPPPRSEGMALAGGCAVAPGASEDAPIDFAPSGTPKPKDGAEDRGVIASELEGGGAVRPPPSMDGGIGLRS